MSVRQRFPKWMHQWGSDQRPRLRSHKINALVLINKRSEKIQVTPGYFSSAQVKIFKRFY